MSNIEKLAKQIPCDAHELKVSLAYLGLEVNPKGTGCILEQVKLNASAWKQEARTQEATVHEIYQLVTGKTGEPGTWHGAEPVRRATHPKDTQ